MNYKISVIDDNVADTECAALQAMSDFKELNLYTFLQTEMGYQTKRGTDKKHSARCRAF